MCLVVIHVFFCLNQWFVVFYRWEVFHYIMPHFDYPFWLSWIRLLWNSYTKSFCAHTHSFMSIYPEVELLSCKTDTWSTSLEPSSRLPQRLHRFLFPPVIYPEGPVPLHRCCHAFLSAFLILFIHSGLQWYVLVVLIWVSLMNNNFADLVICLMAFWLFSFIKCQLKSVAHFLTELFVFLLWACMKLIYMYSGYKSFVKCVYH